MKNTSLKLASASLAVLSFLSSAQAVVITVSNPSFETPVVTTASGYNNLGSLVGPVWTIVTAPDNYFNNVGGPEIYASSGFSGNQTLFNSAYADVGNIVSVRQVLSDNVAAGDYTLTVAAGLLDSIYGMNNSTTTMTFALQAFDGISTYTNVGAFTISSATLTGATIGTLTDYSFTTTVLSTDPLIGQSLVVSLGSTKEVAGGYTFPSYDNVRLDFTAVPEPSTLVLFGAAAALSIFIKRRRA